MRNLLTVCAALVVILGIVSGNLWRELRTARQQVVDLQDQLAQANVSGARYAQVQALPPTIGSPPPRPAEAARVPAPLPLTVVQRPPAPPTSVVSASVRQPLTTGTDEERRADALMQSDRTATTRVMGWSTVLNLKPEQLEALLSTAKAELRIETEESLQIDKRIGPMDAQTAARMQVETVTRQHETNLRILEKMTPQMTPEQSTTMRTMFERWVRNHLATARAELEQGGFAR